MRIAIDVLSIREDGSAGGATGFAMELIKGLSKVPGNTIYVLCADWNICLLKNILPSNIQFLQIVGKKVFTGVHTIDKLLSKLENKINSKGVLHAHKIDVLCCPFSAAGNCENGIPVVSTILDIQHEFYPQFFDSKELHNRRKFYADIMKKADWITCISEYTKATFCNMYGFPEDRATTIYIAAQNRFQNSNDKILETLALEKEPYIVYPANFWGHKNHKLLLNAFSMYALNGGKGKLVLCGNTLGQEEYYTNVIEKLGIKKQVVISGYISNEELFSILKNMKGLIFPSLFEGFGIPIVEAMSLNKLVASSTATSLPEIGSESIFYFDPKKPDDILNGIKYLFDTEMTNEIKREYAKKLEEYQTDIMVEKYMQVFRDVVKNPRIIYNDFLEGMYGDNWSKKEIHLQFSGHVGEQIAFDLSNPEFVKKRVKIRITKNDKISCDILNANERKSIVMDITDQNTNIILCFSPTWNPYHLLKNNDNREIGVMVDKIVFRNQDGDKALQQVFDEKKK